MANEEIIATCRHHIIVVIRHGIVAAILLLLAIAAFGGESALLGFIFLILTAVVVIDAIVVYRFNYIMLTESKVLGRIGFINSKTLSTPLAKVESIGLSSDLSGKIFGYHTITIDNGSGSHQKDYIFKCMANAQEFADSVEAKINELGN